MTYDPLCRICRSRPKMDGSSCCDDCFYSGAYTRATRMPRRGRDAMPPARPGFHWERVPTGAYVETRDERDV